MRVPFPLYAHEHSMSPSFQIFADLLVEKSLSMESQFLFFIFMKDLAILKVSKFCFYFLSWELFLLIIFILHNLTFFKLWIFT